MTVSIENTRVKYAGTGSQTTFPYTFRIFLTTDLVVIIRDVNGLETVQTLGTHYSVTGAGQTGGGNVVMVTAPAATEEILIMRVLDLTQLSDYIENDPFSADTHETGLDRLTMITQQLGEQFGRAFKLPRSSSLSGLQVDAVPSRVIGFDAAGTALTTYAPALVSVANIDYIGNYSDNLATAITAIGAGQRTLLIHKAITVAADATVPQNITLWFLREGSLSINTGKTVTFYCPENVEGSKTAQIFSGAGKAAFTNSGTVHPEWWGTGTSAIQSAIDSISSGTVAFTGAYTGLSNITMVGKVDFHLRGELGASLDFSGVTSGSALKIGYDVASGGCRRLVLSDLILQDTSVTSLASILLDLAGGPKDQDPIQTCGHISFRNVNIEEYNAAAGTAVAMDNINHVDATGIWTQLGLGCKYALTITNTEEMNTGVYAFTGCVFQCIETALKITGDATLIDTIDFVGCKIANTDEASARHTIEIDGTGSGLANINFIGNHIECRDANEAVAIKITGGYRNSRWVANKISASDANPVDYGFHFTAATLKNLSFENNEFMRLSAQGDGGYCFYFENDCVLVDDAKVKIEGVVKTQTIPYSIGIEADGNHDDIQRWIYGVEVDMEVYKQTGFADDTAISFVPEFQEGIISVVMGTRPNNSGVVLYSCKAAEAATVLIGGGADFEVATGALLGTTGTDVKLTVSAHTDGKIYIENRTNATRWLRYKVMTGY